jgi:membrane-bound lytic murein transglycosylase B
MPQHLSRRSVLATIPLLGGVIVRAAAAQESGTFRSWLAGVRREAAGRGIRAATLDVAFRGLDAPIAKVIELDRRQPERVLTYDDYMRIILTPERIETGRRMLAENRALLERIAALYRVQPAYAVALWGIESKYGAVTGSYSVVGALATLAYEGRRARFFRAELMNALRILDQGHVPPDRMLGSWAGAMGQSQFMPSTFLRYAVDWDGDGRRDIWTSKADALASTANFLHRLGWRGDGEWGVPVALPESFPHRLLGMKTRKSAAAWRRLGVRPEPAAAAGRKLDEVAGAAGADCSIIRPADDGEGAGSGPAFLVGADFRALLRWNNAQFFGIGAGRLADAIRA